MGDRLRILGFDCPWFGVLFLYPEIAIDYGCKYLRQCLDLYNGDIRAALLKYNGGNPEYPGKVFSNLALVRSGGKT